MFKFDMNKFASLCLAGSLIFAASSFSKDSEQSEKKVLDDKSYTVVSIDSVLKYTSESENASISLPTDTELPVITAEEENLYYTYWYAYYLLQEYEELSFEEKEEVLKKCDEDSLEYNIIEYTDMLKKTLEDNSGENKVLKIK